MKRLLFLFFVFFSCCKPATHSFKIENGEFLYDGNPLKIYSGEMHYARIPKEYWRHRFQMIKAMGLNTVATYVFWNYHETAPGIWDFETGNKNLSEYIKTAQEEGLFVILRPGPYTCAEWEFGGYPWWLQKNRELVIRANNKSFLDSCRVYINRLAEQVKDLQITKGGPIIMVQAENEFGSYVAQRKDIPLDEHKKYNQAIKQLLVEAGFEVPFFTSDGSWLFEGGSIDGALPTANGEDDVEKLKEVVNQYNNGHGPYMVAEFYPGWLDHWGEPFVKVSTDKIVSQTEKYLKAGVNFNFYMVHGGTNFGFTSGANYSNEHDIQPDITSYDYDAPVSESGRATEKYMAIRELMKKYVPYEVPEIPQPVPVISIPDVELSKRVDFLAYNSIVKSAKPIVSDSVWSFESLEQGHGYVLYAADFYKNLNGKLSLIGLRDYALIFIDGTKVGELNRMNKQYEIEIDVKAGSHIEILVESMGRINYGANIIYNEKGIISPLLINGEDVRKKKVLSEWSMISIPMNQQPDMLNEELPMIKVAPNRPILYAGSFDLTQTGDVFLDMRDWGKGIVFVNGHNLGRYWNVGPQQTLYLPGCWLKEGKNEVVIFEQLNDQLQLHLKTIDHPILESLR
jgi:beta-galactosidase